MQVSILEFVEHRLDRFIIMRQRIPNTGRQARIIDEITKTLACEIQVGVAAI